MKQQELRFALWISLSHGIQHFLRRVFPPLIPIWVVAFDMSLAVGGLMIGAQSLGSAFGQTPMGIISDRYDRRYILPVGIAVSTLFVATVALVPLFDLGRVPIPLYRSVEIHWIALVIAMFGSGLGASVLHPVGYPLISQNINKKDKGSVLGMWGSAAKLGDGVAPAVIGVFLILLQWNYILLLFSVIILGFSGVLFIEMRNFQTLPAARVSASADKLSGSDGTDLTNESTPGITADKRMYLYPIAMIFLFFAIRMIASGGVNVFIPKFITSEYHYTFGLAGRSISAESTASFFYSAMLITAGVAQLGTGKLVDAIDPRKVIISLLAFASVILYSLSLFVVTAGTLLILLLLLGASMWALAPARDSLISEITPSVREGRTFGYLWTGALTIGSISPVVVGHLGDTVGLRAAFSLLALATLVSILPIALLYSNRVWVSYRSTGH